MAAAGTPDHNKRALPRRSPLSSHTTTRGRDGPTVRYQDTRPVSGTSRARPADAPNATRRNRPATPATSSIRHVWRSPAGCVGGLNPTTSDHTAFVGTRCSTVPGRSRNIASPGKRRSGLRGLPNRVAVIGNRRDAQSGRISVALKNSDGGPRRTEPDLSDRSAA